MLSLTSGTFLIVLTFSTSRWTSFALIRNLLRPCSLRAGFQTLSDVEEVLGGAFLAGCSEGRGLTS